MDSRYVWQGIRIRIRVGIEGSSINININRHLSSAPMMTVVSFPLTMDTEGSAMQLACMVLIMTLLAWPRALTIPLIGADPPTITFAPDKADIFIVTNKWSLYREDVEI